MERALVFAHALACRLVRVAKPGHDLFRFEGVVAVDRLGPAQVAQLVEDVDAVGVSALVALDGCQLDLRAPGEAGDDLADVEADGAGDDLADVEADGAGERKVIDRAEDPSGTASFRPRLFRGFFMRAPVGPRRRRGTGKGCGRAARASDRRSRWSRRAGAVRWEAR
jgi:hypothetical protein